MEQYVYNEEEINLRLRTSRKHSCSWRNSGSR